MNQIILRDKIKEDLKQMLEIKKDLQLRTIQSAFFFSTSFP